MAMEQRQRQIIEGAGLDESRLNQDLILALQKWGPYILVGLAVVMGGYVLYNRWEERVESTRDNAFQALEEAAIAGRPESLLEVAKDHADQGAVPVLASLDAADAWLSASRSGIPAGVRLDNEGKLPEGKAYLTDDEKKAALAKAESAYQDALSRCNNAFGQVPLACGALFGLASVAEDRAELDKARGFYDQAQKKAEAAGLDAVAAVAKKRIETLDKVKAPARLIAQADMPAAAAPPQVIPMGGATGTTDTGQKIDLGNILQPGGPGTPGQPIQITPGGMTPIQVTPTPSPAPAGTPPTPPAAPPAQKP